MRHAIHVLHSTLVIAAALAAAMLAGAGHSADLDEVRVTFDRDIAERTNMQRTPGDSSALGVTFDQDVARRTNMQREATDVGTVKVAPDMVLRERTNMGGVARSKDQDPAAPETAATQH